MNRVAVAQELVKLAKDLVAGDLKYNSKVDQWLADNGWKETHGVALYTNRKYPLVGIDTNSGEASVNVFDSEAEVFNSDGVFVDYTGSVAKLEKAVKKAQFLQDLWVTLNEKYRSGYSKHFTHDNVSFFGDDADNVSFHVYTDDFTVVVGGGHKVGFREIVKKMSPSANDIVRFIEKSQQEIKAGGGGRHQ